MKKIAIIGAGSGVFGIRMIKDISAQALRENSPLKNSILTLMDIDEQRLHFLEELCNKIEERYPDLPINYQTTLDRSKALKDSDYVIVMIHPGGSEAIILDNEIPKKWGDKVGRPLMPSVNDTMSAGGIMRGCRTIPILKEILDDMAKISNPEALLLNYSNPMAMNTWAMYNHIEQNNYDLNCVGLCHGVYNNAMLLRAWLGAVPNEFSYTCAGINHMSWYVEAKVKDFETGKWVDAYPIILENIKDLEKDSKFYPETLRKEIMRQFGYFCTEDSGHLSEYLPFPIRTRVDLFEKYNLEEEGKNMAKLNGAKKWTPESDKNGWEQRLSESRTSTIPERASTESASWIIYATAAPPNINGEPELFHFHGNIKNEGCITNLPYDCCVEIPCIAARPSWGNKRPIVGTFKGDIPPQCAALCSSNIHVQGLVVKGCETGDAEYIKYAMMLDPHISQVLDPSEARLMAVELIEAQKKWLPQFNL